ncbi:hypothetical protein P8452_57581 [Trifolium repens]|nr:hypothetical protein P8452_57581 [Trifolium repens]
MSKATSKMRSTAKLHPSYTESAKTAHRWKPSSTQMETMVETLMKLMLLDRVAEAGRNNTNRDNKNGGRGRLPPNDSSNEHGSSEDHYIDNRRRHDHHLRRDPFTTRILGSYIPIALEKPLKLELYNSTIDPDEHVEHIRAQWAIRCKLIVLTLKGAAMTCFKGLEV